MPIMDRFFCLPGHVICGLFELDNNKKPDISNAWQKFKAHKKKLARSLTRVLKSNPKFISECSVLKFIMKQGGYEYYMKSNEFSAAH